MNLRYNLEVLEVDDCVMAVPTNGGNEFRGILHMNGITRDMLELLKNDITEAAIVSALKEQYDATEEQICHSVRKVLDILRENNLLCEP